jgi:hypothetical protein
MVERERETIRTGRGLISFQPYPDGRNFDGATLLGARLLYSNEHAWLQRNTVPIFSEISEFRTERRLHGHPLQIRLGV